MPPMAIQTPVENICPFIPHCPIRQIKMFAVCEKFCNFAPDSTKIKTYCRKTRQNNGNQPWNKKEGVHTATSPNNQIYSNRYKINYGRKTVYRRLKRQIPQRAWIPSGGWRGSKLNCRRVFTISGFWKNEFAWTAMYPGQDIHLPGFMGWWRRTRAQQYGLSRSTQQRHRPV